MVETDPATQLLAGGFVALTGAGMSTDSGIPDYRDRVRATATR